jgi:hypothetical protein
MENRKNGALAPEETHYVPLDTFIRQVLDIEERNYQPF